MANPFSTDNVRIPALNETGIPPSGSLAGYGDLLAIIGTIILAAGIIYVIISAVFQFVFVDCLSSSRILLTRTLRIRMGKGVHLVGFYLFLLAIIILAAIGVSFLMIFPHLSLPAPNPIHLLVAIVETLILLLIILIPVWIVAILTADFVVPVMIVDDTGIIQGWRRVLSLFQGNWGNATTYTGLKILLSVISGVILGIIIFLISIPLDLAGAILRVENGNAASPSLLALIPVILGAGTMILISLLLLVPVITFFRYYSLIVLRDLNLTYNLLSDFKKNNGNKQ
jgi:hypothetical protein